MSNDSLTPIRRHPRNKTVAAWLAFLTGPLGGHRFYLYGWSDTWGWAHAIPTALGLWGVDRVLTFGQDDKLSWVLLPLLGFSLVIACLAAIVYALMPAERWNTRHNPMLPPDAPSGATHWWTVLAVVLALMVGATAFMASLAFGFQRYFEYQIEEGLRISQ
ncbi:TM2 domain-containing protein [Tepidimonas charontis]|uniref:TM2 domain protein n=1 Tax=Tepidimonas charontis TaxID=2267262 RepID=A0A554XFM6_9BURK|nr:TM2 domain-containing protein [Tepidimonas charontis]TSE34626.1 hypothetical protein Tchar_01263 [Tepidimonas charontis]